MVFYSIIFKNYLAYCPTIWPYHHLFNKSHIVEHFHRAEVIVFYYSTIMNFLKESRWSLLTNCLPKPSLQFMSPSPQPSHSNDLNGR